uniref:Uncharacterized protein n=1 Tax=Steinernema glaseri TaxID=37863 RepID=A0A1I7YPS9_9BILA
MQSSASLELDSEDCPKSGFDGELMSKAFTLFCGLCLVTFLTLAYTKALTQITHRVRPLDDQVLNLLARRLSQSIFDPPIDRAASVHIAWNSTFPTSVPLGTLEAKAPASCVPSSRVSKLFVFALERLLAAVFWCLLRVGEIGRKGRSEDFLRWNGSADRSSIRVTLAALQAPAGGHKKEVVLECTLGLGFRDPLEENGKEGIGQSRSNWSSHAPGKTHLWLDHLVRASRRLVCCGVRRRPLALQLRPSARRDHSRSRLPSSSTHSSIHHSLFSNFTKDRRRLFIIDEQPASRDRVPTRKRKKRTRVCGKKLSGLVKKHNSKPISPGLSNLLSRGTWSASKGWSRDDGLFQSSKTCGAYMTKAESVRGSDLSRASCINTDPEHVGDRHCTKRTFANLRIVGSDG